jgi:Fe-S oxidoreductase
MSETNKSVTLFIQCLADGIYPEVGEAVVRIFSKLGISLISAGFQCRISPGSRCCRQTVYRHF